MNKLLTEETLRKENLAYVGTSGVSDGNRVAGFIPAFYDAETRRAEISRFANGQPAPLHLIEGLPPEWVEQRDSSGRITAIKQTVLAGFIRGDYFYTRSQAAEADLH